MGLFNSILDIEPMPRIREKQKREQRRQLVRKWLLTIAIVGLFILLLLAIVFDSMMWLIGFCFFGCIIGGVVIGDLWGLW